MHSLHTTYVNTLFYKLQKFYTKCYITSVVFLPVHVSEVFCKS